MNIGDDTLLVCVPVVPDMAPVAGSRSVPCRGCGRLVWVSPTAVRNLDQLCAACPACALAEIEQAARRGEPIALGGLLPGQLVELANHYATKVR